MSRRRRGLTPEDEHLWQRVAATAAPMHRPPPPKPGDEKPHPLPKPVEAASQPDFVLSLPAALPRPAATTVRLQPAVEQAVAAHPLRMDHGLYRRMTRGKAQPEARLDLHGMTLTEAHPALVGFILRAQAAGLRLVLVITGKGKRGEDAGPIPQRLGALRHQVPAWLHATPLAGIVQQIAPAHQRHGGTGAYYVYLRRPK